MKTLLNDFTDTLNIRVPTALLKFPEESEDAVTGCVPFATEKLNVAPAIGILELERIVPLTGIFGQNNPSCPKKHLRIWSLVNEFPNRLFALSGLSLQSEKGNRVNVIRMIL